MTWPSALIASAIQVALVMVGGPLAMGWMAKIHARAQGRVGAPIIQPWRDLRKLLKKSPVRATSASVFSSWTPLVVVATTVTAAAISPLVTTSPLMSSSADLVVVVFLLLTGSVAFALGGLDPGTAFGGMGASRSLTIGALSEPALFVAIAALSIAARSSNLAAIVTRTIASPRDIVAPSHLLAMVALAIVAVAETGRLPVDNPATHLELTMIHEAMVLEYAGSDLALVELGASMRLGYLFALIATLFAPIGVATHNTVTALALGVAAFIVRTAVFSTVIALVEVHSAKIRLFRLPELLAGSFALAVLAVVTGAFL